MNNIYRTLFRTATAFAAAASLASCIGNYEKYNTPEYSIPNMDPSLLIPAMYDNLMYVQQNNSQMIDQMVGTLGGYFTISNRFGGQNFDTFNPSDAWNAGPYSTPFTSIYANYFEIIKSTDSTGHYYAMARILRAASMMRVADLYGGIPYSKVKDGLTYVEYDSNQDVYKNIIKDLREGADALVEFVNAYPSKFPLKGNDPIYNGDYSMWARLANTLILRAAMRSGDREAFTEAFNSQAGLVDNNTYNAIRDVELQPNPYQLASASWGDLRINASIVDYMNGYNDPRSQYYFTKSTFEGYTDKFIGMRSGEAEFQKADVAGYSMPNFDVSSPIPVFVAAETKFLLAEAALKGWISGDAGEYYKEGIRLSMEQYGVSSSDAEKYISDDTNVPAGHMDDPRGEKYNYERKTKVTVSWESASSDEEKLEKIITQKWIANFPMGLESWAEFRRTGYPELNPAMDNLSNGAVTDNAYGMSRLKYPYTEKDYNRTNYDAAVQMLGGPDEVSTKLFWCLK